MSCQRPANYHYGTELCRFHQRGRCTRGTSCTFAHDAAQLRGKPDLKKTKLCTAFANRGKCFKGAECPFAHGRKQLRGPADGERSPKKRGEPQGELPGELPGELLGSAGGHFGLPLGVGRVTDPAQTPSLEPAYAIDSLSREAPVPRVLDCVPREAIVSPAFDGASFNRAPREAIMPRKISLAYGGALSDEAMLPRKVEVSYERLFAKVPYPKIDDINSYKYELFPADGAHERTGREVLFPGGWST